MASTLWYHTDLDLNTARETLQQAMKSLGVTRFYPPDERFTGTDNPMEAHRRLPDFAAQVYNPSFPYGIGTFIGWIMGSKLLGESLVHLRLYAEPIGTTVASGIGIMSALGILDAMKENRFHEGFFQAWQAHDSSLTSIEHPGYLL